jgi:hypothetical protein
VALLPPHVEGAEEVEFTTAAAAVVTLARFRLLPARTGAQLNLTNVSPAHITQQQQSHMHPFYKSASPAVSS